MITFKHAGYTYRLHKQGACWIATHLRTKRRKIMQDDGIWRNQNGTLVEDAALLDCLDAQVERAMHKMSRHTYTLIASTRNGYHPPVLRSIGHVTPRESRGKGRAE